MITQTTLSLDDVAPIVDALGETSGRRCAGRTRDDICYATQNRQDAVKAMVAEGATLILVIGSETSSNAVRLVEVAQAAGAEATLIDGEAPLDDALIAGHETIGLTAGASTPGAARAGVARELCRARLSDARGDHRRPRGRPFPAAEGGRARMTSIEVPYSIAAALPTLSVMDITNEVVAGGRALGPDATASRTSGDDGRLARARPGARDRLLRGSRVRCSSASSRASADGARAARRTRCSAPRTEQVPFSEGCLCLGQWQRIMLFSLDAEHGNDWSLTLLG